MQLSGVIDIERIDQYVDQDRQKESRMLHEAYDAPGLGREIRRLRADRKLTQEQLAAWLGVSRQTVVSLERGGPVSVAVAMRALAILGNKVVVAPKDAVLAETTVP
jgi:DNA-binding XRE family transcriptional regulator